MSSVVFSTLPGGTATTFSPAAKLSEAVPNRLTPQQQENYDESVVLAGRLAEGAKAAKAFATDLDLQAKRERLRLLKLMAAAAGDARSIRAIAREVGQIVRSLGRTAADPDSAVATPAPDAPPDASPQAEAAFATAVPTLQSDQSPVAQMGELMQLAKKILDELRKRVLPGTREAEDVDNAGRALHDAAIGAGVALEAGSGTSSINFALSVSSTLTVVSVEAEVRIDIKA
jgi:hypothetical protein